MSLKSRKERTKRKLVEQYFRHLKLGSKKLKTFYFSTLQAELGLFSSKRAEVSPLAVDEEMRKHLRPYLADIQAHDIWIRFIYERIEIAKYCSQEQIYMFTQVGQLFLPNFPLRTIYSPSTKLSL